ncbi:MAG: SOS response-associated peptidase family protein [Bacilli bacterium]|nr:SOS response-associated peptidase family protein [Bacilli bacterium]
MCGRYTTNTEEEIIEIREIVKDISIKISQEQMDLLGREVYPTCLAPVITNNKELKILKWGFEKWDGKGVIFNARSEGMEESKYFSYSLKNNRCLVPAKFYFEWERINNKPHDKYQIGVSLNEVIFMAGIIKKNSHGEDEYSIITKTADENINFIHNRMPVIIDESYVEDWLDGNISLNNLQDRSVAVSYEKVDKA